MPAPMMQISLKICSPGSGCRPGKATGCIQDVLFYLNYYIISSAWRLKIILIEAGMLARSGQHEEVETDIYAGGTLYRRHGGLHPAKWVARVLKFALDAG